MSSYSKNKCTLLVAFSRVQGVYKKRTCKQRTGEIAKKSNFREEQRCLETGVSHRPNYWSACVGREKSGCEHEAGVSEAHVGICGHLPPLLGNSIRQNRTCSFSLRKDSLSWYQGISLNVQILRNA